MSDEIRDKFGNTGERTTYADNKRDAHVERSENGAVMREQEALRETDRSSASDAGF